MFRFQELEKAINKGVAAIERRSANSNESIPIIHEWSPNNFRRLIIGFDWAVIVHFVTSQRSRTLIERVDLRNYVQKDVQLLASESKRYKPILEALVSGRVLSSVEEIIFCLKGYPKAMADADMTLDRLTAGGANFETRFPRLRSISHLHCGVEDLWSILPEAKPADKLLLDLVKSNGIHYRIIVEQHQDDWWSGTALRPQYYAMDSTTLLKYFDALKDLQESVKRSERLEKLDADHDKAFLTKNIPPINGMFRMLYDLFDKSQAVFDKSSILNKAEWASYLQYSNMGKGIRLTLAQNREVVNSMRRIDFTRIVRSMQANGFDQDTIGNMLKFRDTLFVHIMNNEEEYKRESNRDNLVESIQTIQKVTAIIYSHAVNIVYLSFIKYLTRNSVEFAQFFYEKLQQQVPSLQYTRTQVEYWNGGHLEHGVAKDAMDKIGAIEVTVEEFKIPVKNHETQKVLIGLLTVAKS